MPRLLIALALLLVVAPGPAESQTRRRAETSLLIGPSPYDLSGTGTGFIVRGALAGALVARSLLLEGAFGYFTYVTQFDRRNHWLFPEVTIQLEGRLGRLRPYAGAGVGLGVESRVGPDRWEETLHGAAGFRVLLGGEWAARGELRLRSVSPWSGNTADFGIGVARGVF